MSEPLVSIVTPFFNTADDLEECIESVLAQTYTNWEYVLSDNCSTDGSTEIARAWAAKDDRIRLLEHAEHVGQVPNYNRALRGISAESVHTKIIQADDFMFPHCIEEMVAAAEIDPRIGIVSGYTLIGSDVYLDALPWPSRHLSGRDANREFFLNGRMIHGNPTWVMFRSDLVRAREPFFDESSPVEDAEICFDLLRDCDFGFVHQVVTYTRDQTDSTLGEVLDSAPLLLTELISLEKFGASCMSAEEYATARSNVRARYFAYIGRNAFRRDERFWRFHRAGLATIGESMSSMRRLRLFVAAPMLRAKLFVERVIRFVRKRLG